LVRDAPSTPAKTSTDSSSDGIISLPIAVFGFLYFPDIPEITKAKYLKEPEKALAASRLPPVNEDGHNVHPWSLMKRLLLTPTL
jgi:ACS family pantothenate transporter-like MFS transporter